MYLFLLFGIVGYFPIVPAVISAAVTRRLYFSKRRRSPGVRMVLAAVVSVLIAYAIPLLVILVSRLEALGGVLAVMFVNGVIVGFPAAWVANHWLDVDREIDPKVFE